VGGIGTDPEELRLNSRALHWLPNLLTVSRIAAIPMVVGFLYLGSHDGNWVAFWIYVYACVTDFFDGWLARTLNQQSSFGRFLDPIADKLLVAAVLLAVVGLDVVAGPSVFAAMVILLREILVSGLREFLAGITVRVPVGRLAKWKTTIQMIAIGFLIVGPAGPDFGPLTTTEIGLIGLWIAVVATLITGYDYLRAGIAYMAEPRP